jgi:hypothetical protein
VGHKTIQFHETACVQKYVEPFARGEFTAFVLFVDAFLAACGKYFCRALF